MASLSAEQVQQLQALTGMLMRHEGNVAGGEGSKGTYGSLRVSCLFALAQHIADVLPLHCPRVLLDFGGGLGRAMICLQMFAGLEQAYGVEFDAWKVAKSQSFIPRVMDEAAKHEQLQSVVSSLAARKSFRPPIVHLKDITEMTSADLQGATVAFSFWEGITKDAKEAMLRLLNDSTTVQVVVLVGRALRCRGPGSGNGIGNGIGNASGGGGSGGGNGGNGGNGNNGVGYGVVVRALADMGLQRVELHCSMQVAQAGSGSTYRAYVLKRTKPPVLQLPPPQLQTQPQPQPSPQLQQQAPAHALLHPQPKVQQQQHRPQQGGAHGSIPAGVGPPSQCNAMVCNIDDDNEDDDSSRDAADVVLGAPAAAAAAHPGRPHAHHGRRRRITVHRHHNLHGSNHRDCPGHGGLGQQQQQQRERPRRQSEDGEEEREEEEASVWGGVTAVGLLSQECTQPQRKPTQEQLQQQQWEVQVLEQQFQQQRLDEGQQAPLQQQLQGSPQQQQAIMAENEEYAEEVEEEEEMVPNNGSGDSNGSSSAVLCGACQQPLPAGFTTDDVGWLLDFLLCHRGCCAAAADGYQQNNDSYDGTDGGNDGGVNGGPQLPLGLQASAPAAATAAAAAGPAPVATTAAASAAPITAAALLPTGPADGSAPASAGAASAAHISHADVAAPSSHHHQHHPEACKATSTDTADPSSNATSASGQGSALQAVRQACYYWMGVMRAMGALLITLHEAVSEDFIFASSPPAPSAGSAPVAAHASAAPAPAAPDAAPGGPAPAAKPACCSSFDMLAAWLMWYMELLTSYPCGPAAPQPTPDLSSLPPPPPPPELELDSQFSPLLSQFQAVFAPGPDGVLRYPREYMQQVQEASHPSLEQLEQATQTALLDWLEEEHHCNNSRCSYNSHEGSAAATTATVAATGEQRRQQQRQRYCQADAMLAAMYAQAWENIINNTANATQHQAMLDS